MRLVEDYAAKTFTTPGNGANWNRQAPADEAAEVAGAAGLPLKRPRGAPRRHPQARDGQAIRLRLNVEAAVPDAGGPAAMRKARAAPHSQSIPTIRLHWESGRRRGAGSGIR